MLTFLAIIAVSALVGALAGFIVGGIIVYFDLEF